MVGHTSHSLACWSFNWVVYWPVKNSGLILCLHKSPELALTNHRWVSLPYLSAAAHHASAVFLSLPVQVAEFNGVDICLIRWDPWIKMNVTMYFSWIQDPCKMNLHLPHRNQTNTHAGHGFWKVGFHMWQIQMPFSKSGCPICYTKTPRVEGRELFIQQHINALMFQHEIHRQIVHISIYHVILKILRFFSSPCSKKIMKIRHP